MKMISRRQSNKRGRLVFFSFFVVFALVTGIFFRDQSSRIIASIAQPLLSHISSGFQSTEFIASLFGDKASIAHERDLLREKNAALESEKQSLIIAKTYSDDVQNVLDTTKDKRIVAAVVSRPNFTPYDTLLIDRGARDGVPEGALVYANSSRAIGYIKKVYDSLSHVALFTTAGVELLVYLPESHALAHAVGMGGGLIRVSVPQGVRIKTGDIVTYPTITPSIIGTVSKIVTTPTNPDVYAFLTVDTVPFSLFVVSVDTRSFTMPSRAELEKNMNGATTTAKNFFAPPSGFEIPGYTTTAPTTTPSL